MLKAGGNSIENEYYRLEMNGRGAIQSLIDKRRGEREIAAHIDGRYLNDLGPGVEPYHQERWPGLDYTSGEVQQPVPHTTEVTLISHSDRIEIRNEINRQFFQCEYLGIQLQSANA